MSLFDCIQRGIDGGEIDAERGRAAQELFGRLRADYAERVGPDAANAQAAEDVKRIMAERSADKKRKVMLRLQAARRNAAQLTQHRTLRGVANPADALRVFVTGDEMSPIMGIVPLAKTLKGFYHAELDQLLDTFGRTVTGGVRNKAKLTNFVREIFGKETGDVEAKALAEAARRTLDLGRRDYNAAGGSIGKIENYGLAMLHAARKIETAGFEVWRDFIWDKLDWNRIVDFDTGQPFAIAGDVPPRGGRADALLDEIFRSLVTQGWSKREASFVQRGLSATNSREASRVLHFRDGDAWLAYNASFGEADPFATLMSAIDGYAHDTAAMRVLGPNPKAGLTYLTQLVQKQAQEAPWRGRSASVNEANKASRKAQAMLDLHSGAAQVPVDGWLAEFLAGTRALLVSAQLGSAAVSAVTDVGFQTMAARKIGLDVGGLITRLGRELVAEPAKAARLGLIAERIATVGGAQARYMGETFTPQRAARLSEFVMRISGLARWTDAGRHAFQLEFMGMLADEAAHGFDAMRPELRQVLERKGFTAADWDVIRRTDLHVDSGATFLVPHQMRYRTDIPADQAEDLAFRLMSVIHEQTEFAVPSASLEGQALFLDQTRPGTLIGELARSGFMYKSFGMTVLYNQIRRTMSHSGTASRVAYAAKMAAMTTIMGALAIQMKEVTKGRDPRPMDSLEFLGAAGLQGGGLGIFGDFLAAETNRFGGGIQETLAGPVAGLISDVAGLGVAGVRSAAGGNGNFGREAVNFLRYNTPVTGVWYLGAAFQHMVYDELQRAVDPRAERAFRDAEKRRRKSYGNSSWWKPGQPLPSRGPNLSAAMP